MKQAIAKLVERNIRRGLLFAMVGSIGFVVGETILTAGLEVFGRSHWTVIYAVQAFCSVTVGFLLNEQVTVKRDGDLSGGITGGIIRLIKFQLVFALGNVIAYLVTNLLFASLAVWPPIGNIAGAIVAYPVNYVVSMGFVWKIRVN